MTVESADVKAIGFGYAQNISVEGVAIDAQALASERDVPSVGSRLRMRFKLPKNDFVITVSGEVLRVDRMGLAAPLLALKFVDSTPDIRAAIATYVASGSKQSI
jgi:hypothetical protein